MQKKPPRRPKVRVDRLTNWEKQATHSLQEAISRKTSQSMSKAHDELGGLMCYLAVVASDVNKTAYATTPYLS